MQVVIVGCGRVGAALAATLDQRGDQVSIIDINPNAFTRLKEDFSGRAIRGTGIDEDILREADITTADAFLAVTNRDNTNLMAAQVAREVFGVRLTAARVYDPVRAEIFANMGIITICPTITITNLLMDTLESAAVERG